MTRFLAIAALLAATFGGMSAASAVPLAPLSASDTSAVIQVAQGCGPGFARGPMGRCRPMGPVVVVRPPPPAMIVRPGRVCPPGFIWRYGRCRPF